MGDKRCRTDEDEPSRKEERPGQRDDLRSAFAIAEESPQRCCDGIDTAFDDEHQSHDNWRQVKLQFQTSNFNFQLLHLFSDIVTIRLPHLLKYQVNRNW